MKIDKYDYKNSFILDEMVFFFFNTIYVIW
jgi:hypothetical protein